MILHNDKIKVQYFTLVTRYIEFHTNIKLTLWWKAKWKKIHKKVNL